MKFPILALALTLTILTAPTAARADIPEDYRGQQDYIAELKKKGALALRWESTKRWATTGANCGLSAIWTTEIALLTLHSSSIAAVVGGTVETAIGAGKSITGQMTTEEWYKHTRKELKKQFNYAFKEIPKNNFGAHSSCRLSFDKTLDVTVEVLGRDYKAGERLISGNMTKPSTPELPPIPETVTESRNSNQAL